jgi:hypothetical protein
MRRMYYTSRIFKNVKISLYDSLAGVVRSRFDESRRVAAEAM